MRSLYGIEADKRGRFLSTLGTLCRILGLPTAVCVGFSLDKRAFAAKLPDHSGDDAENDENKVSWGGAEKSAMPKRIHTRRNVDCKQRLAYQPTSADVPFPQLEKNNSKV